MEFGWWKKDATDGKKYHMQVEVWGKKITWARKHGHHTSWEPYKPTDEDWDMLISEAERRVPRRLFTKNQFEFILSQRPK